MAHLKNTKRSLKLFFTSLLVFVAVFGVMTVVAPQASAATASELCQQQYTGEELEECLIAAKDNPNSEALDDCQKDQRSRLFGIVPKWYKYLKYEPVGNSGCAVRLDFRENMAGVLPIGIAVIEMLLTIAGMVSVIFVMVGGFHFITSQGEPDGVKSARNTIINALIGGAIALIATGLVNFIGNMFT